MSLAGFSVLQPRFIGRGTGNWLQDNVPEVSFYLILQLALAVIAELERAGGAAGDTHATSLARGFVNHGNAPVIYVDSVKGAPPLAAMASHALFLVHHGRDEL